MSFYVYETQEKHARTCEKCHKGMNEGYLLEPTSETYCSIVCIQRKFRLRDYVALMNTDYLFWTTWYDEVEELE